MLVEVGPAVGMNHHQQQHVAGWDWQTADSACSRSAD